MTKNVAIYSFSSGKFLNIRKYACVKDLTNIVSDGRLCISGVGAQNAVTSKKTYNEGLEQDFILIQARYKAMPKFVRLRRLVL